MATTTYTTVNQRTNTFASAKALQHAEPILVLNKLGDSKELPKNTADNIKFRRPKPLTVNTTALTEGTPPTAVTVTYEDVGVSLAQYGELVEITDKVSDLAEDNVIADASTLVGEAMAEKIEVLTWATLRATTSVHRAGGVARNAVKDPISRDLQRKITRSLKSNRAKPITNIVGSSIKYGTEAIQPAFIAVAPSDCESDIRNMDGFVPSEKYGTEKPLPYEIGKVEDCRYIISPVLDPFKGTANVGGSLTQTGGGKNLPNDGDNTKAMIYPILYLGRNAFGTVALKGKSAIESFIRKPQDIDSGNPLGQKGTVGAKCYFASLILNDDWLAKAEVTVTAL